MIMNLQEMYQFVVNKGFEVFLAHSSEIPSTTIYKTYPFSRKESFRLFSELRHREKSVDKSWQNKWAKFYIKSMEF
jgi:hypothetical protein